MKAFLNPLQEKLYHRETQKSTYFLPVYDLFANKISGCICPPVLIQ